MSRMALAVALLVMQSVCFGGAVRHVAANGTSGNNGLSQVSPWDLLTANANLGTSGIDTIKMYSGWYYHDLYQTHSGTANAMLVYMAATDTSHPIVLGNNNGSDYGLDNQIVGYVTGAYVRIKGIEFRNADYGKQAYGTSDEYWVHLLGNYIVMDSCRLDTYAQHPEQNYWIQHYYDRGIVIGGQHVTIRT